MSITSLPHELLLPIIHELPVPDFLSLISTSRFFYKLRNEHSFWRFRVQEDFRIPAQPLLETDGERWHGLYKAMQTQSEVFTWGSDKHSNLGRAAGTESELQIGYPLPMTGLSGPRGIGKIVDVQCGGWSTVLMNSHGKLFAAGVINGEMLHGTGRSGTDTAVIPVAMPLRTPRRWLLDVSHRKMNQFSMGRTRLLALSDHGEVLEWATNFGIAGEVISADHMFLGDEYDKEPRATQVVAGWAHGSALYPGLGIYYWSRMEAPRDTKHTRLGVNNILNPEMRSNPVRIPGTKSNEKPIKDTLEHRIGKVKSYLVLAHHILMLTECDGTNKLFSWRTVTHRQNNVEVIDTENYVPTELTSFYPPAGTKARILDLQGSFHSFGVFFDDGTILLSSLGSNDLLNTRRFSGHYGDGEDEVPQLPQPDIKPVLQNAGIIQLAFGDWHYHALHYNGEVTSYGADSDCAGQLGFGRQQLSMLRGVSFEPVRRGMLELHQQSDGRRRIWFEPEKFIFQSTMLDKFLTLLKDDTTFRQLYSDNPWAFRQVYGEWFEQEGQDWSIDPSKGEDVKDQSELPAYFPIKIAAAGWSSAAVVLVDPERAEQDRQRYLLPQYRKDAVKQQNQSESESSLLTNWVNKLSERLAAFGVDWAEVSGSLSKADASIVRQYVWSEMEFPRLRLPGNDSLVVDGEPTRWKKGEPAWLQGGDSSQ